MRCSACVRRAPGRRRQRNSGGAICGKARGRPTITSLGFVGARHRQAESSAFARRRRFPVHEETGQPGRKGAGYTPQAGPGNEICRAPSVDSPSQAVSCIRLRPGTLAAHGSTAYRCFLPDLTGFTRTHCTRPDPQRRFWIQAQKWDNLEWEFGPAIADCGYRAPLPPHLARQT